LILFINIVLSSEDGFSGQAALRGRQSFGNARAVLLSCWSNAGSGFWKGSEHREIQSLRMRRSVWMKDSVCLTEGRWVL